MAPVTRKRSLADMQHSEGTPPTEYNNEDYVREVLQLENGQTEALFDESLIQEAEKLGITISRPPTANENGNPAHHSMCESANTVASHHVRTASSESQDSASTGMTSRSSNNQSDLSLPLPSRKRSSARRSMSFSEYEKYLAQHDAQEANKQGSYPPPPIPNEPAPSLFSVSTRKSYASIKSNFKNRFRLRRKNSSLEDAK